jgi:hypothetical protein
VSRGGASTQVYTTVHGVVSIDQLRRFFVDGWRLVSSPYGRDDRQAYVFVYDLLRDPR